MSKSIVERRLLEVSNQLKRLREDLSVVDEQLAHFAEEAEDARIRAMVSETPGADRERRQAQKHADAMARHQSEVHAQIQQLEADQDQLLDRLQAEAS